MENAEALVVMNKELYVAAMEGNVRFLEEDRSDEYLLRKTHNKSNIIHIAVRNERLEFIEAILRRFLNNRELICEENSQKDTPLHIAAEVGNVDIGRVIYGQLEKIEGDVEKPWRVKNLKGNTAAHHALIHGSLDIAMFLLQKDPGFAQVVNQSDQTLLHLAITRFVDEAGSEPIRAGIGARQINYRDGEDTTSMRIISTLVEIAGEVTCWHDTNGLTPLHRAASLDIPYNFEVTTLIIQQWPPSAEECDNSGKTILHLLINRVPSYTDCESLLGMWEVYNLRNCQDHQGNTPLHIAACNMDISMVRVLLEFNTNFSITNMEGISAASIIQQQNLMEMLQKGTMTKEDSEAADIGDIDFLKERLKTLESGLLRSRDSNGENILHKLFKRAQHGSMEDFVKQVLSVNPSLVSQADFKGDTPIHVLVRHPIPFLSLHSVCASFITINVAPTWTVQNADGNTPLHAALLANNFGSEESRAIMFELIQYCREAIGVCNNDGENPFHLIQGHTHILWALTQYSPVLYQRDKNGLTPLMRALQGRWERTAMGLYELDFSQIYMDDNIMKNSVLHMAIQNEQFHFVNHIFYFYDQGFLGGRKIDLLALFKQRNNDGVTPTDLLGEIDTVPPDLAATLWRHPELRGIRSTWGIPKSQLQNYMSSMNVIAALLTTITFTAAFTVPGGLNQDKGTPILMSSTAFQVFLISDVIAMCLSMMVLFCLLWSVAIKKRDSVMILDFALSLLLASFAATLLTFMTGVYATIFPVKPRIAIATLVLCSILMLLVRRFILTKLILPLKNAIAHPIHTVTNICFSFIKKYTSNLIFGCVKCFQ